MSDTAPLTPPAPQQQQPAEQSFMDKLTSGSTPCATHKELMLSTITCAPHHTFAFSATHVLVVVLAFFGSMHAMAWGVGKAFPRTDLPTPVLLLMGTPLIVLWTLFGDNGGVNSSVFKAPLETVYTLGYIVALVAAVVMLKSTGIFGMPGGRPFSF